MSRRNYVFTPVLLASVLGGLTLSLSGICADSLTAEQKKILADSDFIYSYGDAANANLKSTGIGAAVATVAKLSQKSVDQMTTNVLIDADAHPVQLTDENINKIMSNLKNMKTATTGIGALGGGELTLTYDEAQVNRVLGNKNLGETMTKAPNLKNTVDNLAGGELNQENALIKDIRTGSTPNIGMISSELQLADNVKPRFVTKTVNLRTASLDGIKAQLSAIKSAGAHIKFLSTKSLVQKLTPGSLKAVALFSSLFAAERAVVTALDKNLLDDAVVFQERIVCDDRGCEKPGLLKRLFSSAPQDAYNKEQEIIDKALAKKAAAESNNADSDNSNSGKEKVGKVN